jgi:hypothetical protein
MTIQFVVEDGTSKADATSYVTEDEYKQYWLNRGLDYSAVTSVKAWLNQAAQYIDNHYRFLGCVTLQTQALQWPRAGMVDSKGNSVVSTTIPTALKSAACEVGNIFHLGKDLDAMQENIQSKTIGPVSVSYAGKATMRIPKVDNLLASFIDPRPLAVRV